MSAASQNVLDDQVVDVSTKSYISKAAGILSVVFAFTAPIAGIVMGVVGILTHNRQNGQRNSMAIFGLVMSIIMTIVIVVGSIMLAMTFMRNLDSLTETCQERGPGRHRISTFTSVTCGNDGRILDIDF